MYVLHSIVICLYSTGCSVLCELMIYYNWRKCWSTIYLVTLKVENIDKFLHYNCQNFILKYFNYSCVVVGWSYQLISLYILIHYNFLLPKLSVQWWNIINIFWVRRQLYIVPYWPVTLKMFYISNAYPIICSKISV